MKMFLLGMLVMYLGTSVIALLVGSFTKKFESDFLEIIFLFPFMAIATVIKYGKTFFQKNCWYLFFHGINPFCMNFGIVCEKLNDDQLRKFVELSPKKDQKNIIKVLTTYRGYDIMNI